MKELRFRTIILLICFLSSLSVYATLYVGGASESLPTPRPIRGTLLYAYYTPQSGSSEYIMCNGSSVKATKYTSARLYVRCDYYYEYTDGYTSLGTPIVYRKSGTEYYGVEISPVEIIAPSSIPLKVGEQKYINWSYSPFNVSKPDVEWRSNDYSVVDVSSSGNITAKKSGTAKITGKNNAGNDVEIKITVKDVPVTSASISSTYSVYADKSTRLSVTVYPSDATIKTKEWTSADSNTAYIDRYTGELTGVWPGTTKVWCMVNGTVKSNEAEVTVEEPTFGFKGFSVTNGTTDIETLPTLTAEFSHDMYQSENFYNIALTNDNGDKVDGIVRINGSTLSFTPKKHLQPLTRYTWSIPVNAVRNKWGTGNTSARTTSFTTTDWQYMTLAVQPKGKFLTVGDEITLICSKPEATIYYSTDGNTPTKKYQSPLIFEGDIKLRAIACLDGYYDTDELTHEYVESMEIAQKFPSDEPLYNYADVIPCITFSYPIVQGTTFDGVKLYDLYGKHVDIQLFIQGKTLYIVPSIPLQNGCNYTITVPEGALSTVMGEQNKAIDWRFSTGDYATVVSTGGSELSVVLKTDGSLWTWGRWITEANADDGSYSYDIHDEPKSFVDSDVVAVSSGHTHHALVMKDGTLWMWGRQLCGEFGNGSNVASATPIYIMESVKSVSCGLQTTAIVKQDGSLWMCGRNDLGQIDDTRTSYNTFVKVMDAVESVELGYGSLSVLKGDGSIVNRTWDETIDQERKTQQTISDAAMVDYGWHHAIALGIDGSVWAWADANAPSLVMDGRNPKPLEGIMLLTDTLRIDVGSQMVIPMRPVPLLANYTSSEWHVTDGGTAFVEVSTQGVVKAISDGKAVVEASLTDHEGHCFTASCVVLAGNVSAIREIDMTNSLRVIASHGQLQISGVPKGTHVDVYRMSGSQVYSGRMSEQMLTILVNSGIYVVKAGMEVCKVMVR